MTTREFVERVHEKNPDITRDRLHKIIGDALDQIDEEAQKETLSIFRRSWKLKTRKARTGTNPRTGEPIQIPEVRSIVYRKRI